ncbi:MAG: hypothetical protein KJS45_09885 [Bacteroidetes bacterium]|nr:hypothetical protein [Bacteroidota bacterium]
MKQINPLLLLSLLMMSTIVAAQPFSLDDRIQPIELNLIDYKKSDTLKRGRINITEVTQTKDTLYFFVKGISIYSPIYYSITTKDEAGNIRVNLCKDNWKTINREGETGSAKHWEAQFKTEGDFGIQVITENKPATYTMLVWVGDEAKDVGVTSIFKEGAAADASSSIGSTIKDNLLYIVIGLLVLIIALLLLKLKKK